MHSSSSPPTHAHIRLIRPTDLDGLKTFLAKLSPGTLYFRFGRLSLPTWTEQEWLHLCSPNPERFDHFVAIGQDLTDDQAIVGVARLLYDNSSAQKTAEFSLVVADHQQHLGLGKQLMQALIARATQQGLAAIYGDVLPSNRAMIRFCEGLGFVAEPGPEDGRGLRMVRCLTTERSSDRP